MGDGGGVKERSGGPLGRVGWLVDGGSIVAGKANGGAPELGDVEADGALDRGGSVDGGAPEHGGVEADGASGRGGSCGEGSIEEDGAIDRGGRSVEADGRGGIGVAGAASLLPDGIDMFVVIRTRRMNVGLIDNA